MIIIQPSGGLCNRMRAINSAHLLAKKRGDRLIVLWYNCPELNCPFESLFQPTKEIKIINIYSLYHVKKLFYQLTASQRLTNDDILTHKTEGILNSDFESQLKKRVYISTWEHFYPSVDYHLFTPTTEIEKKINTIVQSFGSLCIGVHIRRTDNLPSKGLSTTEQFVQSMKEEILLHKEVTFYLATDDPEEETFFRTTFPNRIISHRYKILDRNSPEGIKDALIDLLCLSKTKKILGSFYSSFTDIAADMHKIPKVIVGQSEKG